MDNINIFMPSRDRVYIYFKGYLSIVSLITQNTPTKQLIAFCVFEGTPVVEKYMPLEFLDGKNHNSHFFVQIVP